MNVRSSNDGGQLALDLTPRPPVDITARFIDYLRSEPSAAEVAQEVVLRHLGEFQARGCVVSMLERDGSLRIAGGFGFEAGVLDAAGNCSLWERSPLADAITGQATLVMPTPDSVAIEYSDWRIASSIHHALVAVPLTTTASTVGSICVCFDTEGSVIELAARHLEAIADVYVLFLLSTTGSSSGSQAPPSRDPGIKQQPVPVIDMTTFTRRQRTILNFLRDGMTYDQIAARIGYSHSTVRMELMRMYRVFGVKSRREAVSIAERRGLLPSEVLA